MAFTPCCPPPLQQQPPPPPFTPFGSVPDHTVTAAPATSRLPVPSNLSNRSFLTSVPRFPHSRLHPPAADIYPPGDTPDMPEPPVPGKGPFMHLGRAAASRPIPADSHKWCGSWGAAGSTPPRAQQGGCASRANSPALLLKTDGGNVWLEARAMHGTAFWADHAEQGGGKGAQEDLEERGMPSKEGGFTTDKEGAGMPAVSFLWCEAIAGGQRQGQQATFWLPLHGHGGWCGYWIGWLRASTPQPPL